MSHYYQYDPKLKSNKKLVTYTFKEELVKLNSDNGVFSKERVDFGTNVLLNSLDDKYLTDVKTILDVGCGYGIIGVSLSKKYNDKKVTMIDVNPKCIELVKENIKLNDLKNADCLLSDLYSEVSDKFDMIISNPPIRAGKEVVFGVVTGGYNHLNKGGIIVLVIQKKQGAPSLKEKMQEVFGNCDVIAKDKGYFILKSERNN